jgi:hypothetical protein
VKAFEAVGLEPPDTSRAGLWLAQGYRTELIVPTIETVLARVGMKKPLTYFDGPLADAHANPPPPRPINGARHHGHHRPTSTLDVLYRELEHEQRAKREAEPLRQIGSA